MPPNSGLFVQALGRYLGWYLRALVALPVECRASRLRRLLFLLVFPVFLAVQLMHWVFLLLDEVLFADYRHQALSRPLFILGIPRSGTTFLHRQLATDPGLSTPTTWEVLLAPSICQRRLVAVLALIDRLLGRPVRRLLDRFTQRAQGGFASIHAVELGVAEEDYLALLPLASCFLLLLAFPAERALLELGAFRDMSEARRQPLLDFYHGLLQRHCYCHPGKRLLSKNAAFAEWPQALLSRYPDAGFILCVRPPEQALASQLAALDSARSTFAIDGDGTATKITFAHLFARYYANLAAFLAVCPKAQQAVVAQPQLRRHTAQRLQQLSVQFALAPQLPGGHAEGAAQVVHRYPGLDAPLRRSLLIEEMRSDYRELQAASHAQRD